MKLQKLNIYFIANITILIVYLFLAGCQPIEKEHLRRCQGAGSVDLAVDNLKKSSESLVPFKAIGKCHAKFSTEEKKYEEENFNVKVWVYPENKMWLQGDIAFEPKGIVLGTNEQEFWFYIKPELSSYYWGRWSESDFIVNLIINPKTMLEAFGIFEICEDYNYLLNQKDFFDVLTVQDCNDKIIKKMYIYKCDYKVRKIEYFNSDGKVVIVLELGNYKQLSENSYIPSRIKIVSPYEDAKEDSFTITLTSIKQYEYNEKQIKGLFKRPSSKRFENVYQIIDGNFVEQE